MLCEKDYKVEIVTSSFAHMEKKQREFLKQNVADLEFEYTTIYEPGYPKNVCVRRFYSHYIMGINLKKYLKKRKKPDVIYCAIPSFDVASVAATYARKNKIRFIIDVQDLWPEAFEMVFNMPIISDIVFAPMKKKANIAYRQADEVIAVSDTYKNRALQVNKKCKIGHTIFLGTSLERFDRAASNKNKEYVKKEIWLAYCGTLGHSYDIRCAIDAMAILKERGYSKICLVLMGDGPLRIAFEKYAIKRNVNVKFLGLLDYEEMCSVLSMCDIAINPIVHGAAQSIINKHADYAAAGIPVISTQENEEYRKLVEQYNMGFNCENGNALKVAKKIELLIKNADLRHNMGSNARRCFTEKFDRMKTYQEIISLI